MKIRDIMTTDVEIAEPDDTLDDIASMMRNLDVGAIPVVEDGELIGIVTDRDIVVRCVADGKDPSEVAVDEIISGDLQTIAPDADVKQARRIMAEQQIRRLPVVEDGKLVGMVSIGDIAVKTNKDQATGDLIENVSEGVRATNQGPASDTQGEDFVAESGGALKKAPKTVTRTRRSNVPAEDSEGRQERLEQGGRQGQSLHGRIEEQDQGLVDREQNLGRRQGIANRDVEEEVDRQRRVIPIRAEEKPAPRGQKGKSSKRKTG